MPDCKVLTCLWRMALIGGLFSATVAWARGPLPRPLTLDQAVAVAVSNNRLVKEAVETSRSAEEARKSAKADFFPKASAEYSYTHFKDQPYMWVDAYTVDPNLGVITGAERYQKKVSDHDRYTWNLTLTQPLFTGYALSTRLKMADLGIKTRNVEEIIAVQDVVKQAKQAFINVLLSEKLLNVAQEAERSIAAHERNARLFFDQGMIPYNDQLQAQVALADATQRRVSLAARLQMAVSALNVVLDVPVDHDTVVAQIPESFQEILPDLGDLMDAVVRDRPELKAMDLGRQQLEHGVVLARSAYYPTVSLFGQYRQRGENPAATKNSYDNQHNALVGVQARWTFFEWGKTRADEARVRHDLKALDEKIAGVTQAMQLEVKDAYTRLMVARENVRTADAVLAQASENLRIVNLRYAQQMSTSTDVLDANTKQARAQTNYYGAVYGCHFAMAELERAVGKPLTGRTVDANS